MRRAGPYIPEPVTQRVRTADAGLTAARTWYFQTTGEKYNLPPKKEREFSDMLQRVGRARVTCGGAALLVIVENDATADLPSAAAER